MAKKTQKEVRARRKTTSFSMVANPIIDDKKISPAAGWLYVLIQRWITFNAEDFVCSKSFLLSKYNAGEFMFNRAWDELKEAGYLKMFSHPTEGWEFELLDTAKADEPHTYYLDLNGEVKSTNIDRAKKKAEKEKKKEENNHYPENHPNGDHYPENHSNGNHSNGNHSNGDHSNGNQGNIINTPFKDFNNSFYNDNQSIYLSEAQEPKIASALPTEKKMDRVIDKKIIDMNLLEDIKEQIQYDVLCTEYKHQPDEIDIVVSILAEFYTTTEPQTFDNRTFSADFVNKRSLAIDRDHVDYVFECFEQQREKVFNVRKYLRSAIFNAPDTFGAYITNKVRADGVIW